MPQPRLSYSYYRIGALDVSYPVDSSIVQDVLNCGQAASVGGGCKLPGNVKK